jgi:hypothetical protein
VNKIIKKVVMLPFLLILVVSLASGLQYSNPAFGTETDKSADTSEARSQKSSETQSEEGSATSNASGTETNQSADTSDARSQKSSETQSEEGSATSNNSGTETKEPTDTSPNKRSNLTSSDYISNQTGKLNLLGQGTKIHTGPAISIIDQPYKVTVKFLSITVHESHDKYGLADWHNFAYVQGKRVDLVRDDRVGLHVRNGLYYLDPSKEVTVYLGKTIPLSIFTVGYEYDCGLFGSGFIILPPPKDITNSLYIISGRLVLPIFDNPQLDWLTPIAKFQNELAKRWTSDCGINPPDILGTIREFYDPPGYGAGYHVVKSSNGDFTLRYTISLAPLNPPGGVTVDGGPGSPLRVPPPSQSDGFGPGEVRDHR